MIHDDAAKSAQLCRDVIGPKVVTRNEHQARGTIVVSVVMVGSARIEHVPFTALPFNHSAIKMKKMLELKVPQLS